MPVPAPPIVSADLDARTRALLARYAELDPRPGDPADALVAAFVRLAEIVAERVNQVPEKNLLAFLHLVGVRPLPPQPARVPLTFHLATGAAGAVVPARSIVAAAPREGETEPVLFETEAELTVTAAQLAEVLVHDPTRDAWAAPGPGGGPFTAFAGDTPVDHRLYLSVDALAAPGDGKNLQLDLGAGELRWLALLEWEIAGPAGWTPLQVFTEPSEGVVRATGLPALPRTEVAGRRGAWLRARLGTALPAGTVDAAGRLGVAGAALDGALSTSEADPAPLAAAELAEPFEPFLATTGAGYLLACDDAFAKPGARITLDVDLDDARRPLASIDLRVRWSYSGTEGWTQLDTSGPYSPSASDPPRLEDRTYALTSSGRIAFTAPPDWTPATPEGWDGPPRRWLRAEIVAGAFTPEGLPRVAALRAGYRWALPRTGAVTALVELERNDPRPVAAFADQRAIDLNKDFKPFGDRPAPGTTFYLADDDALRPGADVALTVAVTTPTGDGPPPAAASTTVLVRWEYFDGALWRTLGESGPGGAAQVAGFADGTNAFLQDDQTITFHVPDALAPVAVNGVEHRWIRARIVRGDYGHDTRLIATSTAPFYAVEASNLRPPSIARLSLRSTWVAGPVPVDGLVTERDAELTDRTGQPPHGKPALVPFGPSAETRPALYLGFDRPFGNAATRLFAATAPVTFSAGLRAGGEPPAVVWERWDADQAAWTRLETLDGTRGFTRRGLVTFVAPDDLAPSVALGRRAVWVRARWERGAYAAPPRLERVLTNTMWAQQSTTVDDDVLGSSTGEPGQGFAIARTPVLPGELVEVREPGPPGAGPVWTPWTRVVDFHGSSPLDRHYVLDPIAGTLAFGDGRTGAIPPQGTANVRATRYRTGGGRRGNRPAGAITQLRTTIPYVDAVTNHDAATGGSDAEAPAALADRGPRTLRHGDRAVATEDFEDLAAQASPDLARVQGIPVRAGEPGGPVLLVIVPRSEDRRPAPSLELVAEVEDHLAARVAPTFDLWVGGPGWVQVTVEAEVVPVSLEAATDVESAVLGRLGRFLHPLTGGFEGAGWPFGRRPHRSDVHAWIEATPGVDHVRTLVIREDQAPEDRPPAPEAFLVFSGDHRVTVVGR